MRRNIKKLFGILIASAMLLTFAACSNNGGSTSSEGASQGSNPFSTASGNASSGSTSSTVEPASSTPESTAASSPESKAVEESSDSKTEDSDTESSVQSSTEISNTESSAQTSVPAESTAPNGDIGQKAVGDWTMSYAGVAINLTLGADGSAVMESNGLDRTVIGTWGNADDQIIVYINNTSETFVYKDDKLYATTSGAQSLYFSRGTTDLSNVPDDDDEDSDDGDDEDELEFGGHTDSQYVGSWKVYIDPSLITEETSEYIAEYIAGTKILLNADGTAAAVFNDEKAEGVWESNGTKVNIIFEGSKEAFNFENGMLMSASESGLGFIKE